MKVYFGPCRGVEYIAYDRAQAASLQCATGETAGILHTGACPGDFFQRCERHNGATQ